jgi:hypothetical protein
MVVNALALFLPPRSSARKQALLLQLSKASLVGICGIVAQTPQAL